MSSVPVRHGHSACAAAMGCGAAVGGAGAEMLLGDCGPAHNLWWVRAGGHRGATGTALRVGGGAAEILRSLSGG